MKETGIISELLKKYDLVLPVLPSEQRKILRSKRRTLAGILSRDEKKSLMMTMAVNFYYLMRNAGLQVTPATGARAVILASVMTFMVIATGSVFLVRNYVSHDGIVADRKVTGKGVITAASDDLLIKHGNKEIISPQVKFRITLGDEIKTGDSSVLLQFKNGAVVKILKRSSVYVARLDTVYRFELKNGGLISRVPVLANGSGYEVQTPDSTVKVKGTEFGVFYENGKTRVIVFSGKVLVRHIPSGTEYEVPEVNAAEASGDKKNCTLNERDLFIMKSFADLQYLESVDLKTAEEFKAVKDLLTASDNELVEHGKMTFGELKKKYGKLDEVMLYNGKKYTGVIVSRGRVYKILTPAGTVSVSAKDIKGSRVIR